MKSCGEKEMWVGQRYESFLHTIPWEVAMTLDRQMQDICRSNSTCRVALSAKYYREAKYTLNTIFEGTRHPDVHGKEGWQNLAHYLYPINEAGIHDNPVEGICGKDWEIQMPVLKDTRIFAARAGTRAYPAHQHAKPEMVVMLILKGKKKVMNWPTRYGRYLYPMPKDTQTTTHLGLAANKAHADTVYLAEPWPINVTRQPDLLKAVDAATEIMAEAGDLLFLPCSGIHIVHNLEDVIAISLVTGQSGEPQLQGAHGWTPEQCKNPRLSVQTPPKSDRDKMSYHWESQAAESNPPDDNDDAPRRAEL
jgi:hypothetical protein